MIVYSASTSLNGYFNDAVDGRLRGQVTPPPSGAGRPG